MTAQEALAQYEDYTQRIRELKPADGDESREARKARRQIEHLESILGKLRNKIERLGQGHLLPVSHQHPPNCQCGGCRMFRAQLADAKTTRDNRVTVTVHLTREEVKRLEELADREGASRKAATEAAIRTFLQNA